ncbi:MAG TPA: hypothetical protein VKQ52_08125 [Puia sp.]|nr:hypothetical protein [Puia sp.]
MNCLTSLTAAWMCLLCSNLLHAQDRICLENEMRQGKVNDISLSTVRYTPADRPNQPMLLPLNRILILFNSDGGYLVPSQMDSSNPNIRAYLNRFFSPPVHTRTRDQVFTVQHTLLEVKIAREDDEYVYWEDNGRINKKDIAAVIYSNGTPKVLCSMSQAALILGTCQRTPLNLGIGTDLIISNEPVGANGDAGTKTGGAANGSGSTDVAPVLPAGGSSTAGGDSSDSINRAKVKALLGNVKPEEFTDKAQKKTVELTGYLKILCDKTATTEDLDKAVAQALALFISDSAVVEVSSNNRNAITRRPIREYLRHLKQIQYDKIEVKWTHVQYVSELKPGPDGRLYGTVSFEQEFKGYKDGKLVYSDVTIKHANVVLVTYQKITDGSAQQLWDVRLGDIGVFAQKT